MSTIATFFVRNDKFLGLLVESMEDPHGVVYFFKIHNQPIGRHCTQMQNIIKAANVKQTRKITINITDFIKEYYSPSENYVWFKGTRLESTSTQISKVRNREINKKAGALKRAATIKQKNQQKAAIEKEKYEKRQALIEKAFQDQRAKRIHEFHQELMRKRIQE